MNDSNPIRGKMRKMLLNDGAIIIFLISSISIAPSILKIEFEKGKKTPHFLFIKSMLIGALKNPLTCNFVFMIIGEPYDYKIDVTIK